MAGLQLLDTTLNADMGTQFAALNAMLTELYAAAGNGGALTPATIVASGQVTADGLKLDAGTKTAAATSGAATLNKDAGVITTEALTTAAGASYTLTLTDSSIAAADQVFASVSYGSATAGQPVVTRVKPAAGSVVIVIQNIHASAALDGTLKIAFFVLKN